MKTRKLIALTHCRAAAAVIAMGLVSIATTALADVASRVEESNSVSHGGVLAYVRDTSLSGIKTEKYFFGEGLSKVARAAQGFQIQIVEPKDIPGGALPGSFVVLSPNGHRVVSMQRGYNTIEDLAAFVAASKGALETLSIAQLPQGFTLAALAEKNVTVSQTTVAPGQPSDTELYIDP